jgi:hypothetical protein
MRLELSCERLLCARAAVSAIFLEDAGGAVIGAGLGPLPLLKTPECLAFVAVLLLCSCSLGGNNIEDAGAAAIGAALVHMHQLQTLQYVACARVLVRGRGLGLHGSGAMARDRA